MSRDKKLNNRVHETINKVQKLRFNRQTDSNERTTKNDIYGKAQQLFRYAVNYNNYRN